MRELLDALGHVVDVALEHPFAAIVLWLIAAAGTAAGTATYRAIRRVVVRRWQKRSVA